MAAIVAGAAIVIGWLVKRLSDKEDEIKQLHAARYQDRKDFDAQTNVMLQNIYRRKGGVSP